MCITGLFIEPTNILTKILSSRRFDCTTQIKNRIKIEAARILASTCVAGAYRGCWYEGRFSRLYHGQCGRYN